VKKTIEPTIVLVTSKTLDGEEVTSTLCTLDHTCRHTSTALTFGWDEEVVFSLAPGGGEGPVSITGYLQPSPEGIDNEDDMMYNGEEEEEDDEDDDDEDDDDEEDDEDDEEVSHYLSLGRCGCRRNTSCDVSAVACYCRARRTRRTTTMR
jgi:hypothetical protein